MPASDWLQREPGEACGCNITQEYEQVEGAQGDKTLLHSTNGGKGSLSKSSIYNQKKTYSGLTNQWQYWGDAVNEHTQHSNPREPSITLLGHIHKK